MKGDFYYRQLDAKPGFQLPTGKVYCICKNCGREGHILCNRIPVMVSNAS